MYQVSDQSGRRFVVTGANIGLGKEAVKRLAGAGAEVIMAVRTPAKGEATRADILREYPDARLEVRRVDLADLAVVAEFAQGLIAEDRPVHTLINNAGVMAVPKRLETADGFELQWGSNFLGPFALTMHLLPLLLQAPSPRVVTMSSAAANFGTINFRDLDSRGRYISMRAYAASKLGNLLMGRRLADVARERNWSLISTVAHPGLTHTNLTTAGPSLGGGSPMQALFDKVPMPAQEVQTGAEPMLFGATDPAVVNGAFYGPSGRFGMVGPTTKVSIPHSAKGATLARSLWAVAEDLTGTSLPERSPVTSA